RNALHRSIGNGDVALDDGGRAVSADGHRAVDLAGELPIAEQDAVDVSHVHVSELQLQRRSTGRLGPGANVKAARDRDSLRSPRERQIAYVDAIDAVLEHRLLVRRHAPFDRAGGECELAQ